MNPRATEPRMLNKAANASRAHPLPAALTRGISFNSVSEASFVLNSSMRSRCDFCAAFSASILSRSNRRFRALRSASVKPSSTTLGGGNKISGGSIPCLADCVFFLGFFFFFSPLKDKAPPINSPGIATGGYTTIPYSALC
jgi:hypothetical protein